jgi:hypothetical protein
MKKLALLLVSHGLALGAGWLTFRGPEIAADPENVPAARLTKKPRPADDAEGRRVLAEMRQGWGTESRPPPGTHARESVQTTLAKVKEESRRQQAEELEEIRKRSLAVVLPADPAAALAKLAAGPEILDTAAFAIAWLRADPAAALGFLQASEALSRNSHMTQALEIWVAEVDLEEVAALLDQAPAWQEKIAASLMKVAANQDTGLLDGLLEELEGKVSRERLIEGAMRQVSAERRADALAWILGSLKGKEAGRAVMMVAIGMDDNATAKTWLKQAREGLDPEAMKELKGWGNYIDIMRSGVGPDSPMEERVEAMLEGGVTGKTDVERLANARASIVSQDLSRWMGTEQLAEAVKSGGMGAAGVWQEAAAKFPQYVEQEREGMLRAVFSSVAAYDPEGAIRLLEDQGMGGQAAGYVSLVMDRLAFTDFERTLDLVACLPEETLAANLTEFDRRYSSVVMREAERRGSFWTEWLRQQPAGVSKDLMLHYTARHYFKTGNEALGTELKNLVRDPTVKSWPKL